MRRLTLLRHLLPGVGLLFLPGCLAINALFGGIGLIASGPIQYVGTVYTIGEYAYEYAANDRNPAEVLGERIDLITSPDQWSGELTAHMRKPRPDPVQRANVPQPEPKQSPFPDSRPQAIQVADASDIPFITPSVIRKHTPIRPMPGTRPLKRLPAPSRARPLAAHAAPGTTGKRTPFPLRKAAPVQAENILPATGRSPATLPDPLLARLNRLQQSFHQAEILAEQQGGPGIRIRVGPESTPGLNGTWSIRHPLMQHPPGPPRAQLRVTMSGT